MGIIQTNPGSPLTIGGASGGKVYAYNAIDTTPGLVAPANPQRQTLIFHNPGTVDVVIFPATAFIAYNGSSPSTLTPTASVLGGGFRVYANGGTLQITGECQGQWQALSVSGTGNPLTVMDSNL